MSRVGIIDIGIGNIGSVVRAFDRLDIKHKLIKRSVDVADVGHLILPGVGNFDAVMKKLIHHGFDITLSKFVKSGNHLLGICVGMQVLGQGSEEGFESGLNLIDGTCVEIKSNILTKKNKVVGWYKTTISKDIQISNITPEKGYYFVHGYEFKNTDKNANTESIIGSNVTAIIQKENIIGFQFHPEKSNIDGQRILKRFSEIV
ncbi:imidazole glycerol phosphate synthase subunit HisH [Planktomarina sp.]|nr:imidazole glycerol phosphate synthase subunit HisH [Planktomarina sp.]